ncbi:hypothetical protein B0A50_00098 [Salinomyces thailandicus]|uniref:BZIP transcription factor n=1 Tax=Salinomyces thailandicus TaxID=706561 RepID=A0A4U0UF00_9PEZI|nr:hypothetical protein B0A50_00098 [Salinomyces thailandica]
MSVSGSSTASPPEVPDATVNLQDGRKRKASGQPGSRGVANLTPEQLSRKRANDRDAQRGIRTRAKQTLEAKDRRIAELESQQPHQDLQKVKDELNKVCAERDILRERLERIVGIATGPMGTQGIGGYHSPPTHYDTHSLQAFQRPSQPPGSLSGELSFDDLLNIDPKMLTPDAGEAELACVTAQQEPLPTVQQNRQKYPHQQQDYLPSTASAGGYAEYQHQPQHQVAAGANMNYSTTQTSPVSPTATAGGASQHYQQQQQPQYGYHGVFRESQHTSQPGPTNQHNGGRHGIDFVLHDNQHEPKVNGMTTVDGIATVVGIFSQLPNNSGFTCPLDRLLLDCANECRRSLANGEPTIEVLGPFYPSFEALLVSNPEERDSCHRISKTLVDIIVRFPDISGLPEKVAVLYVMFLVLRWVVCPCESCYERMPEWIRPVVGQMQGRDEGDSTGHAVWIDHLPWYVCDGDDDVSGFSDLLRERKGHENIAAAVFVAEMLTGDINRPRMRALLSTTHPKQFDQFFVPFTRTLSLNWPPATTEGSRDVLVPSPQDDTDGKYPTSLTINPDFEEHLRDLSNWSLGREFASEFPDLMDEGIRMEG